MYVFRSSQPIPLGKSISPYPFCGNRNTHPFLPEISETLWFIGLFSSAERLFPHGSIAPHWCQILPVCKRDWPKSIFARKSPFSRPRSLKETGQHPRLYLLYAIRVNRPLLQGFAWWEQVWNPIVSTLIPEVILSFSVPGNRIDDPMLRQLFDKVRCSGRLEVNRLHHIRTSKDRLTRKDLLQLQYMTYRFWPESFFNVRFQRLHVRFWRFNVRFFHLFERSADMQCPVMQRMGFIQQKIAEECLQILRRLMNSRNVLPDVFDFVLYAGRIVFTFIYFICGLSPWLINPGSKASIF